MVSRVLSVLVMALALCGIVYIALPTNLSHTPANDALVNNQQPAPFPPADPRAAGTTPLMADLITANNAFGFHLYAELAKTDGGKNLFISPLSLECALTMTANGAHGKTFAQMKDALGWGAMPLEKVNAGFQTLIGKLLDDGRTSQGTLANSLWLRDTFIFRDDFLNTNKQHFGAEMRRVTFTDPATVPAMNDWVNKQSHGMIPQLVEQKDFNGNTTLVLLNALYFRDAWTKVFSPHLTTDQPFRLADGETQTVKMMRQSGYFQYYQDDQLQLIELPFNDRQESMLVILPRAGHTLADVARTVFSAEKWPSFQAHLSQNQGSLSLPRFKADYTTEPIPQLQALGMIDAFDPRSADFSGIATVPTYISLVRHKTALEVDENGAKAAAATEVTMAETCPAAPRNDPTFTMTVDHPFLVAIRHQDGTLLFLGSIVKPEIAVL